MSDRRKSLLYDLMYVVEKIQTQRKKRWDLWLPEAGVGVTATDGMKGVESYKRLVIKKKRKKSKNKSTHPGWELGHRMARRIWDRSWWLSRSCRIWIGPEDTSVGRENDVSIESRQGISVFAQKTWKSLFCWGVEAISGRAGKGKLWESIGGGLSKPMHSDILILPCSLLTSTQSVVCGPVASASAGGLLKCRISGPMQTFWKRIWILTRSWRTDVLFKSGLALFSHTACWNSKPPLKS